MLDKLARRIPWRNPLSRRSDPPARAKGSGAAIADAGGFPFVTGAGGGWNRAEYGEYYATSTPVYSAIRLRADALTRPPVVVYRRGLAESGVSRRLPVGPEHPAQQLLERVNRWYTRADLWRATEIYLNLWGSAYWMLDRDSDGNRELWPLRPDRVSIVPDRDEYIRGFVYHGRNRMLALTPDEVVRFRYFNPLEEYAGMSPVGPSRLAVDMGKDGLSFNRNFLRNSAQPDFVILTNEQMNDGEVDDFYRRWEARYRGPANARRPAVASFVRDIKPLGLSHREMDFIQGLRWSLEEVSRAFGVPRPLLSDLERATFSNVNAAERFFWRNTMVPEMTFLAEQVTRNLFPLLGYEGLEMEFDLASIEALAEDENARAAREAQLLDRGVLTINEVRRSRGLPDVPWGDVWAKARG